MKLYRFTEGNDWEGEIWHFYMYMSEGMKKELERLISDNSPELTYDISDITYDIDKVDALVKDTSSGYMDKHNWCGTLVSLPTDEDFGNEEDGYNDPFYKGKIEKFCEVND